MGKASKELNGNRNETFNELNQDFHRDNDDNLTGEYEYFLEKDLVEKIETCALRINRELMQYVDTQGLHMCEFLELNDIENYVSWLVSVK